MDKRILSDIWVRYGGRILCTILATFLGLIYLVAGFWKMIIFSLVIAFGYFVGLRFDQKEDWKEIVDKLFIKRWTDQGD